MPTKAGNLCLYTLYFFFSLGLVGLGLILAFLGCYEMYKIQKANAIDIGTTVGGLLTSLIGLMTFCGRRSLCIVGTAIFFKIILLCAYIGLTVCYWMGLVCQYDQSACDDAKKVIGDVLKFVFLGADGLIVLYYTK